MSALLVSAVAAAPAAAAITTSQTLSGSLGAAFLLPAGFSTTLNFNPFSNPGEVLTSVKLSFSSGFQTDFGVGNINILPPRPTRSVTLARGISAGITGNGFGMTDSAVVSKTLNVSPNSTVSFGNYAPSVGDDQTLLAGNPVFAGPGPVSFQFSASQFGNSIAGSPNLGNTVAAPNLVTATSFYDVTLTYESELASAVPEPESWAMMIAGFGLAGAALRRRRTAMA